MSWSVFGRMPRGEIHMEGTTYRCPQAGGPCSSGSHGFQSSRGITGKELNYGGTCRHHAAIDRGWRPFRPPDPPLEPADEAVYFGARNGIHIIDLSQTVPLFARAIDFVEQTVRSGGKVLFVRSEERRVGKECRSRWSP